MRKRCIIDGRWFLAALVIMLGLAASPSPAAAGHITCGAVLGPGGTFTLDSNVGPCATDPALTVVSATLDLNGFTVSGLGHNTCIQVNGTRSVIRGPGTVQACLRGLVVAGGGRHIVRGVTSQFHGNNGFLFASHNSALVNSVSQFNTFVGIAIGNVGTEPSRFNVISGNTATGNGVIGFEIVGQSHFLVNNTATATPSGDGFLIVQGLARGIALIHNTASDNGGHGFNVFGDANFLHSNTAEGNGMTGFAIQEHRNTLEDNTARDNSLQGFSILGDGNAIRDNVAANNDANGIEVQVGATGNMLTENTGTNNSPFDLADDNPNCDQNRWRRNTGTRTQNCIR